MGNTNLFEVCASVEDLGVLNDMKVVAVENVTDEDGKESVSIDFIGPTGQILTLNIADGSELHRSARLQPIYCAQDIRNFEGYTIREVTSDDDDLECRVHLENSNGDTATLSLDDMAFVGDVLFVEE